MVSEVKIVSFDPSLSNFGIAWMTYSFDTQKLSLDGLQLVCTKASEDGGKKVRKNSDDLERAAKLAEAMRLACDGRAIAIAEVPVGSQSARAMVSYGVCIGVLASCPIPLIQVTPGEVKLAGAGVRTATKQEMIEWATQAYPHKDWLVQRRLGALVPIAANEHLADAVAAAEAGIRTQQFRQATSMMKALQAL